MDLRLFLKAAAVQAALVGAVFVLLVLAPLPEDFFRRYGAIAGPTAWLVCSWGTFRILKLDARNNFPAALVSGLAGGLAGVVNHTVGLVVGVLVFGAACAFTATKKAASSR